MLSDLANRFMATAVGTAIDTHILVMPMEIVDANLCGDEWMLVVTSDGVQRLEMRVLHESKPDAVHEATMTSETSPIERTVGGVLPTNGAAQESQLRSSWRKESQLLSIVENLSWGNARQKTEC